MLDQKKLLEYLKKLPRPEFKELVFKFGLPAAHIDESQTQAEQAIDLIRYADGKNKLEVLEQLLAEHGIDISPTEDTTPAEPPEKNHIPIPENEFFTGRVDILSQLQNALHKRKAAVLHGLPGIGKTQIAARYAYQQQDNYQAVLWVSAESADMLRSSFADLDVRLGLPIMQEQGLRLAAVRNWLKTHDNWLLIADNVEDWASVEDILPLPARGHVIFTAWDASALRLAEPLEVDKLPPQDCQKFISHRLACAAHAPSLSELISALDGLPLALDQAAAYMLSTQKTPQEYLELYRRHAPKLLDKRGDAYASDHPESVARTWALSFEKISEAQPAAGELLKFCAFLHPDRMPEELFSQGSQALGEVLAPVMTDELKRDEVLEVIYRYALLRRKATDKTLSMHRLVQLVLCYGLTPAERKVWAERVLSTLALTLPQEEWVEFKHWPVYKRLLPCLRQGIKWQQDYKLATADIARMLNQTGQYFRDQHAEYKAAEVLIQRSLAMREALLSTEHPDTAWSLNNLAELYRSQGKYAVALPLHQKALDIRQNSLGLEHSDTASSLNNLSLLYQNQGKYAAALPLSQKTLSIKRKVLGEEHPDTASGLNNLAFLYQAQGNYAEALSLYQQALKILQKVFGKQHPNTANSLNNLAFLYDKQGKYAEALPLYQQALKICQKVLGKQHPNTATSLSNQGLLYAEQEDYSKARPLLENALKIYTQALGERHPNTRNTKKSLQRVKMAAKRSGQAARPGPKKKRR